MKRRDIEQDKFERLVADLLGVKEYKITPLLTTEVQLRKKGTELFYIDNSIKYTWPITKDAI